MWIPPRTEERHRRLLQGKIEIRELPEPDSAPAPLGAGEFVVADFWRPRFPDLVRQLDGVRVVQAISAGVEDLVDQLPEGVVLCDGAGVHDAPVAEWIVMAILASRRQLPQHVLDQERGVWRHPGLSVGIDDVEGATVLIVGYGSIGRAVEQRLRPFGAKFLRVARHEREGVRPVADLPALLPQADVVVILLPLTNETQQFVDRQFLTLMRPGALLVNASRGRTVDMTALVEALAAGRIRAALDVTDPEPLPEGHPLWRNRDALITPHIGGSVVRAYDRAWPLVADQLRRYLNGEPLRNVVTEGY